MALKARNIVMYLALAAGAFYAYKAWKGHAAKGAVKFVSNSTQDAIAEENAAQAFYKGRTIFPH